MIEIAAETSERAMRFRQTFQFRSRRKGQLRSFADDEKVSCVAGDGLRIRTLSTLKLDQQIGSDGATWLEREMIASERKRSPTAALAEK